MSRCVRPGCLLSALLAALLLTPARADDPDPEPHKLKVLSQPEDKARKADIIFVATPHEVVDAMLKLGTVTKKDVVFDLGCGDGRIVVAAAKTFKCQAVGFEIDPKLVKETKANIEKNKVRKLAHVRQRDIFKLDLSEATVVTLYLLTELNTKLVPQLNKMKKGSRIVTQTFDLPDYQEDRKEMVKTKEGYVYDIYLYTIPLKKKK